MNLKALASIAAIAVAGAAQADWTLITLNPATSTRSVGNAGWGAFQGGYAVIDGIARAYLWQGSAASGIDLRPNSLKYSEIRGMFGNQQVGYTATAVNTHRAAIWSGTAASWVDVHPDGAVSSSAEATDGTTQVGTAAYFVSSVTNRAALWQGTTGSYVDLGPPNAGYAIATAVLGNTQVGQADGSPCLWHGTAASFINLKPAGYGQGRATCLTSTRQGGTVQLGGKNHAILWSGSADSYVDLHSADATDSFIRAMLGNMQVGSFVTGGVGHACFWTGTAASRVDLSVYLPAAGYAYGAATAVSTDGTYIYITGAASDNTYVDKAVVWRLPIEEGFSFRLNKSVVAGQNSVQGTIAQYVEQLTPAKYIVSDDSSLVTTPPSVTVAANTLDKNFQITVMAVNSPINATIYAKRGTVTKSVPLTLTPLVPTALAFTPNPVTGGQSVSARVVINGVAGPTGRTISLFDNSPYATTPSSVTVPPGATEAMFEITTRAVPAQQTVTVTARVSAGEKTGAFRITP